MAEKVGAQDICRARFLHHSHQRILQEVWHHQLSLLLFCEEIYLGEQCKEHQLDVVYEPSLRIDDEEHASTGSFKGKKYCQFNYQALSYIIKKYY